MTIDLLPRLSEVSCYDSASDGSKKAFGPGIPGEHGSLVSTYCCRGKGDWAPADATCHTRIISCQCFEVYANRSTDHPRSTASRNLNVDNTMLRSQLTTDIDFSAPPVSEHQTENSEGFCFVSEHIQLLGTLLAPFPSPAILLLLAALGAPSAAATRLLQPNLQAFAAHNWSLS